jgi:hypothetical protein
VQADRGDGRARADEPLRHVGELLPMVGRRGGLAVRAGEHGGVRELVRHAGQPLDDAVERGQLSPRRARAGA